MTALPRKQVKVDLKEVNNQVVTYGDLKIALRLEWAPKSDERSYLILEFYDEASPQSLTMPALCLPNTVHYLPQHSQITSHPPCPHPHICPQSSSVSAELVQYRPLPSITPNEHSDVTSTTSTMHFESNTPLSPEQEKIRKIKSTLQSEMLSLSGHTTMLDLQQAIPEFLSQPLPMNMNDPSLDNSMSDAFPLLPMDPALDAFETPDEFSPGPMSTSSVQSIFCPCSNPTDRHEQNCPAVSLSRSRPRNFPPGAIPDDVSARRLPSRRPPTVHTYTQRTCPVIPTYHSAFPWLSPPTPTTNLFQPATVVPGMTTAISQPTMFTVYRSASQPTKPSPPATDCSFHSPGSILSSPASSNYLPSPPAGMMPVPSPQRTPTASKSSQHVHTTVQGQSPHREQLLTPNLNDLHLKSHHKTPSNSPSSTPHAGFFRQNTTEAPVLLSTTQAQRTPSDNSGEGDERHSPTVPPSRTNVKSPVELDIGLRERFVRSSSSSATTEIERIMPDVPSSKNVVVADHPTTFASWQLFGGQAPSAMENQALSTIYPLLFNRQEQMQPCEPSRDADVPLVVFPLPMTHQLGTSASASNQLVYGPRKRGRPRRTPVAPPKPATTTGAKRGRKPGFKVVKYAEVSNTTSTSMSSSEAVPSSTASPPTFISHNNRNDGPDETLVTLECGFMNALFPSAAPADRSAQTITSLPLVQFTIDDLPTRSHVDLNLATPSFSSSATSTPTDASSGSLATFDQLRGSSLDDAADIYETFSPPNNFPPGPTWQENQCFSNTVNYTDFGSCAQAATSAKTVKRDSQTMKTPKRPTPAKANAAAPVQARRVGRPPGKVSKKNGPAQSTATKVKCTQCGSDQLTDVTGHEFANKKGLVFECTSCGNTSLRSNASPAERRARLNQVATDHLDHVKCQFCQMLFTSHPDYMKHLKNDHGSDKPT